VVENLPMPIFGAEKEEQMRRKKKKKKAEENKINLCACGS
jgi:hypothetical protein